MRRQGYAHVLGEDIVETVRKSLGASRIRAIKRGAVDFLMKPFSLDRLATLLKGALSEEAPSVTMTSRDSGVTLQYDRIIGTSKEMQRIFATIDRVAMMNSTVLIHGESGTGKELIAHAIHYN